MEGGRKHGWVFFFQAEDGIRDVAVTGVQTCLFFLQAEDGIRDVAVTGAQTCALPISPSAQARRNTPCGADGHWPPGKGAGGMAAARTWQTPRNRHRVSGLRKLLGLVLGLG